ncbi:hypothetical protein SFRURICE_013664 [Spodoptera frugiperda]|nr:hypothetical protein SFRURICE_013664 [Spodoptera frugiperda]
MVHMGEVSLIWLRSTFEKRKYSEERYNILTLLDLRDLNTLQSCLKLISHVSGTYTNENDNAKNIFLYHVKGNALCSLERPQNVCHGDAVIMSDLFQLFMIASDGGHDAANHALTAHVFASRPVILIHIRIR